MYIEYWTLQSREITIIKVTVPRPYKDHVFKHESGPYKDGRLYMVINIEKVRTRHIIFKFLSLLSQHPQQI